MCIEDLAESLTSLDRCVFADPFLCPTCSTLTSFTDSSSLSRTNSSVFLEIDFEILQ